MPKKQLKLKKSSQESANLKSPLISVLWKIQQIIPFNILTPSLAFFVLKCLIVFAVIFSAFEKKNVQNLIAKLIDHQNTSIVKNLPFDSVKLIDHQNTSVVENLPLDSEKLNDSNVTSHLNTLSQKIRKKMKSEFKEKHLTKSESTILSILTNPNNWLIILPMLSIVSVYFRHLQLKNLTEKPIDVQEPVDQIVEQTDVKEPSEIHIGIPVDQIVEQTDFEFKLREWLSTKTKDTSGKNESIEEVKIQKEKEVEMVNLFQNINQYYTNTLEIIRSNFEETKDIDIIKLKEKIIEFEKEKEIAKKHPTILKFENLLKTIMTLNSIILLKFASLE